MRVFAVIVFLFVGVLRAMDPISSFGASDSEEEDWSDSYSLNLFTSLHIEGVQFEVHELVYIAHAMVQGKDGRRCIDGAFHDKAFLLNDFPPKKSISYQELTKLMEAYRKSSRESTNTSIVKAFRGSFKKNPQGKVFDLGLFQGAWFGFGVKPFENTFVSILALLDLIQVDSEHFDSQAYNMHAFFHVFQGFLNDGENEQKILIHDLYGDLVSIEAFGGVHPLAHSPQEGSLGSQAQEPLENGRKLNPIFQKEGHILIAWLRAFLDEMKTFSISVEAGSLRMPNYDDMKEILEKGYVLDWRDIEENDKKATLVREVIVPAFQKRLSTFECMLKTY